jgi:hypothetical protein
MRTHRGAPEPTRPALSSPSSTGYAATHGRYSSAMMSTASHSLRIHVLIDLIHSHQTVTMPATSASNCIHVIMTAINMRALLMRDKRGLDAKSLLDGIAATVDRVERKSGCCFPSASHTHDGNVQDLLLEVHLQIGLDVVRTSPIAGSMQLDELHRTSHLREPRTDACRRSVYLSARLGKKDVYSQILPHLRLDPPSTLRSAFSFATSAVRLLSVRLYDSCTAVPRQSAWVHIVIEAHRPLRWASTSRDV